MRKGCVNLKLKYNLIPCTLQGEDIFERSTFWDFGEILIQEYLHILVQSWKGWVV